MPHTEPKPLLAILLTSLAGLAAASCASTERAQERSDRETTPESDSLADYTPPAIASLLAIADRESQNTLNPNASPLPPPTGLDAAQLARLDPIPPEASIPLAELLPTLRAELPTKPVPPLESPTTEEAEVAALRLYARARAAANANEPTTALADVDAALKLAPLSPQLWRLRGDILAATAQRLGATTSYQRTIDLGLIDARACYALAVTATERQDHGAAARYLAAALDAHRAGEDPALPILARAALGVALHKTGHLRAGNEALGEALGQPLQFTTSTAYRNDLQTLSRRRSDLFRDVGDSWSRLGQIDNAIRAYEQAASNIAFDPSSITARRVYALLNAGRPAQASLTLLQDIVSAELRADDQQLELLAYLDRNTTLGTTLADALSQLPDYATAAANDLNIEPPRITPTIQSRLARAAVLIAPPSDRSGARAILARHLIQNPTDLDAARAWVALLDQNEPARFVTQTIELVEQQPLALLSLAEEFTRSDAALKAFSPRSEARPSSSTLLRVRAAILASQGAWNMAPIEIRQIPLPSSTPSAPSESADALLTLDALIAASCGDHAHADSILPHISSPLHEARILLSLQRPQAARSALARISGALSLDAERLSFEVAMLDRDATGAEAALRRAISLDPFDETLHDSLSGLYRQGAPLADQEKLFATYRELRDRVPSSRLLRTLSAQEAAQRNALPTAEQELTALVTQDPDDTRSLQSLLAVWERLATADTTPARMEKQTEVLTRAESLLTTLRAQSPGSHTLTIALAKVLTMGGRTTEAETLLREHINAFPSAETSEALESLLKDALARADEADTIALTRLTPTPRPISATLELASLLIARRDISQATDALVHDLPSNATLTPSQSAQFLLMLAEPASQAAAAPPTDGQAARLSVEVLRLLDLAVTRSLQLPPALHEFRLVLLARDLASTPDRIIDAAVLAQSQIPQLGDRVLLRTLASLAEADRLRDAIAVLLGTLERAPGTEPSPDVAVNIVRLVIAAGNATDLDRLLNMISTRELLSTLLSPIHPDGAEALAAGDSIDAGKGELAFIVANYLAISDERASYADDVYRLALRYDPLHAMAANNLGYTLLEAGTHLDEAESLLELAHKLEPQDANIADSLGWLRYQQGILHDTTSPDGSTIEGALSLLSQAIILDEESGSPVSLDHYADALFASGDPDGALLHWEQALATLEREIQENARNSRVDPAHEPLKRSILSKLAAVRGGEPPEIAPMRLTKPAQSTPELPEP